MADAATELACSEADRVEKDSAPHTDKDTVSGQRKSARSSEHVANGRRCLVRLPRRYRHDVLGAEPAQRGEIAKSAAEQPVDGGAEEDKRWPPIECGLQPPPLGGIRLTEDARPYNLQVLVPRRDKRAHGVATNAGVCRAPVSCAAAWGGAFGHSHGPGYPNRSHPAVLPAILGPLLVPNNTADKRSHWQQTLPVGVLSARHGRTQRATWRVSVGLTRGVGG